MAEITVSEPIPIFEVAGRYLLYDINTISYIRRKYHICGVLIGGIPQASSQVVFSGIPLELLPEEARLLVEQSHAFILDDAEMHKGNLTDLSLETKETFRSSLEREGLAFAELHLQEAAERKKRGLGHENAMKSKAKLNTKSIIAAHARNDSEDLLFNSPANSFPTPRATPSPTPPPATPKPVEPVQITPTTSCPPLEADTAKAVQNLPAVPSSYPLFVHLHAKDYFLSPGLRFGCQYVAYPGDPLRFHSHFLTVGREWDEEIDLLDIVGGGRLGTGVKKGYMIGGCPSTDSDVGQVRTFTFEWASM